MSTLSLSRPTSATGAAIFNACDGFDFDQWGAPADQTPLNTLGIPNLGLSSVLTDWNNNLAHGCRVWQARSLSTPVEAGRWYMADDFLAQDDSSGTLPALVANIAMVSVVERGVSALANTAKILAMRLAEGAAAEVDQRLRVGPVTEDAPYRQPLWVLVTGDDALSAPTGRSMEALAHDELDRPLLAVRPDEQSAVDVVGDLQRLLGVSAASILRASGISRRTYQYWKATGATPRLNSQARLWDLALTVSGWVDVLGDELSAWIRHPDRLALLDAGDFDSLTGEVLSRQARRELVDPQFRDRLAVGFFETTEGERIGESFRADDSHPKAEDRLPRTVRRARRATRVDRQGRPT